jgi:hypothetical protein
LCRQPANAAQERCNEAGSELALTVLATGFGISLHIVKKYKLLNRGCTLAYKKHNGSQASIRLTPNRLSLIRTLGRWTDCCNQQTVTTRKGDWSLISYQVPLNSTP